MQLPDLPAVDNLGCITTADKISFLHLVIRYLSCLMVDNVGCKPQLIKSHYNSWFENQYQFDILIPEILSQELRY